LKSTRIKTRLPFTSTSATVLLAMIQSSNLKRPMLRRTVGKSRNQHVEASRRSFFFPI
jgi:hypothetical protein